MAIGLETIPASMFHNEHQTRVASDEAADDVLVKTFELANNMGQSVGVAPRRVTWDLLYDPDGKQFFFNAHFARNTAVSRAGKSSRLSHGN